MSIKRELSIKELRIANDILDVYDEIPSNINEFDPLDIANSNINDLNIVISKFGGMNFKNLHSYIFESLIEYQIEIIK